MLVLHIFLIKILLITFVNTSDSHEKNVLPKLFYFNDSEVCPDDKYFCRIDIKVRPADENNPSEIWKAIERRNNDIEYKGWNYDRSYMFRGYCLDDIENLEEAFDENFTEMGVLPSIEFSHCEKSKKFSESWSGIDVLFLFVMSINFSFIIYSTIKTYQYSKSNPDDYHFEKVNKYVKSFSLLNNWRILMNDNKNDDFKRLLAIQGLRNINILSIILTHTFMTNVFTFSKNPEFLEEILKIPFIYPFAALGLHSLQGFFVIGSFLFAMQLQNIVDKNGKITLKDISILVLNRYFRYFPVLVVNTFMHRFGIIHSIKGPMYASTVSKEVARCENNWWVNFLFIQNWNLVDGGICSPGTWYIAADTQLHCLTLIAFYISRKYGISLKYIFGPILASNVIYHYYTSAIVQTGTILHYELRSLIDPNYFEKNNFFRLHISTHIYLGSYIIGFMFGLIYTKKRNVEIFNTFEKKLLWCSSVLGLLFLSSYPYFTRQSFQIEVLKAIFLRPIYGLGYALAILGMATKSGGFVKRFLEWKPLVIIANFTFCIYIFHFIIVFGRLFIKHDYANFNHPEVFKSVIIDITNSLLIGIFMFFVLEKPCFNLQKLFLPQVKHERKTDEIKGKIE